MIQVFPVKKIYTVFIISTTIALGACGNRSDFTEPPAPDEVETTENGKSQVKIKTLTGADPNMNKTEDTPEIVKVEGDATAIEWLDFETAIDRNNDSRKYLFIDIYTDWCTWCKKMDNSTFKDPSVVNYMDQHFYAVKIDAESKEAIAYKEMLYEAKAYGNKIYNELAVNLLAGNMTFPSFVILNKREVKRGVIQGYQAPQQLLMSLKRYVE